MRHHLYRVTVSNPMGFDREAYTDDEAEALALQRRFADETHKNAALEVFDPASQCYQVRSYVNGVRSGGGSGRLKGKD